MKTSNEAMKLLGRVTPKVQQLKMLAEDEYVDLVPTWALEDVKKALESLEAIEKAANDTLKDSSRPCQKSGDAVTEAVKQASIASDRMQNALNNPTWVEMFFVSIRIETLRY